MVLETSGSWDKSTASVDVISAVLALEHPHITLKTDGLGVAMMEFSSVSFSLWVIFLVGGGGIM